MASNSKSLKYRKPLVLPWKSQWVSDLHRRNVGINANNKKNTLGISEIQKEIAELERRNEESKITHTRLARANFESRMAAYHEMKMEQHKMFIQHMLKKSELKQTYLKLRQQYNELLAKKPNDELKITEVVFGEEDCQNIESEKVDGTVEDMESFEGDLDLFL